jgi:flavin-dependent dehydrogenase
LRGNQDQYKRGNIFLIGDSIGLATLDMGEGIGPAVQSGLNAAESILGGKEYSNSDINKCSLLPSFLQWAVQ